MNTISVACAAVCASIVTVGVATPATPVAALPEAYVPELVADIETNVEGVPPSSIAVSATHVYRVREVRDDAAPGGPMALESMSAIDRVDRTTGQIENVVPVGAGLTRAELWFVENNRLYLSARTDATGTEPWVVDLSTGSSALLADLRPGADDSSPRDAAAIDGAIYFAADDGVNGRELWRSNGTPGSVDLVDVNPGAGGSDPRNITEVPVDGSSDVAVFFSGDDGTSGTELHRIDGSTVTTYDLRSGSDSSSVTDFGVATDGALYARARDVNNLQVVVRLGTPSTTPATDVVELIALPNGNTRDLAVVGSSAFAVSAAHPGGDGDLYVLDDKNAALALVAADTKATAIASGGGGLFMSVYDSDTERYSMLVSDGAIVETVATDLDEITIWERGATTGGVPLAVTSASAGSEPWVSGGTVGTTLPLGDVFPGVASSRPTNFTAGPGGGLVFYADDGIAGTQLWQSDFTAAGTARLTNVVEPPSLGSNPRDFLRIGELVYFQAETQATGDELWVERGRGGPVELVADLVPGPEGSGPRPLVAFGNRLLFVADGSDGDEYTFVTDGTSGGTKQVAAEAYAWAVIGDSVAIETADDELLGWNDTTGTFAPLGAFTDVAGLVGAIDTHVFIGGCSAECGIHAVDTTDGSSTLLIPSDDAAVLDGVVGGDHAVLHVRVGNGAELRTIRTDGTVAGTTTITEVGSRSARTFFTVDGGVIFASRETFGDSSFTSVAADGTVTSIADPPGLPVSQVDAPDLGSTDDFDGGALAIVDRGQSATNLVSPLATSTSSLLLVRPTGVTVLADFEDFTVAWADVVDGEVLFVVVGSERSDVRLELPSQPALPELWASDGTTAGTRLVYEFGDDDLSSIVGPAMIGRDLYFGAQSPNVGSEPFRLPLGDPEPIPSFVSLEPGRILDTRDTGETVDDRFEKIGRMSAGDVIELDVTGRAGVADDARSAVLNVTMVRPDANGFLAVYPCGVRPVASSMNAPAARSVVANELIAKLSPQGTVCIYASVGTHVVADVTGYTPGGSDYASLKPARVLDTREDRETGDGDFAGIGRLAAGDVVELDVLGRNGVPSSGVGAVVLNVTMIRPDGNGFITTYPCETRPVASTMNAPSGGKVVANEVVAKVSAQGTVCLYSSVGTHLAADVVGYVPDGAGLDSLEPARLLDTRDGRDTVDGRFEGIGRLAATDQVELDVLGRGGVPPTGVAAVVLNVTMVRPDGNGFVTISPCGDRPLASSLNAPVGRGVVANEVIAKVSDQGTVCLYTAVGTHLVADVTGYVAG